MSASPGKKIGVLYGGSSSEREISLLSGRAVYDALRSAGTDAALIDVRENDFEKPIRESGIDFAFIALHGKFGEDGVLQTWLEKEGIQYSGSGPDACRRAMDKEDSRRIFSRAGLRVARGVVLREKNDPSARGLGYPVFVKPASSGSSIAVSLVKRESDLDEAIRAAFEEDSKVIVEERIVGREFTVGVLGADALGIIEIGTDREFFDYEAKYRDAATRYETPTDLAPEVSAALENAALAAHRALGCAGFSRVDLILSSDGPYVLEINAIPGLTAKSLLPKMAAKKGISFSRLCAQIMDCSASERRPSARAAA